MRHECECQHNARNIHYQDVSNGLFGTDSSNSNYEKERNVQNAIEILCQLMSGDQKELDKIINNLTTKLKELEDKIDINKFVRMYNANVPLNNPQLILISSSSFNSQPELAKNAIYFVIDSFTGDIGSFEENNLIFERSSFIKSLIPFDENGNIDYDNFNLLIEDCPHDKKIKDGKCQITKEILEQAEWVKNNKDKSWDVFLEKYGNIDADILEQWENCYDNFNSIDALLMYCFNQTWDKGLNENAINIDTYQNLFISNDTSFHEYWRYVVKYYDPLGYWQLPDIDQNNHINSRDATSVLQISAKMGTIKTDNNEIWEKILPPVSKEEEKNSEIYNWIHEFLGAKGIDIKEKIGREDRINANLATKILQFSAKVGTSAEKISTYEKFRNYMIGQ